MNWEQINTELNNQTPQQIIDWAVKQSPEHVIVSSNFRPQEAVILHMAVQVKPNIPVLFADSGYNTRQTYQCLEKIRTQLNLNLKIYSPMTTVGYRDVYYGGIPSIENQDVHDTFTQEVKLEPFNRGLNDLKPRVWLTALRKDQTDFRKNMNIATLGKSDIIKVCPLLNWTHDDMEAYLAKHNLPSENNYFDPTKVLDKRECGLHPNF